MAFLIEGAALTAEAPYSSLFSMLLHITAAQRAKPTETNYIEHQRHIGAY